jgi:hypothetical protein
MNEPTCCDGFLSADRPDVAEVVEIDGVSRSIDRCIVPLVRALNDAGLATVASCCGHGHRPGWIALSDGRQVMVVPDLDTARFVDEALHG